MKKITLGVLAYIVLAVLLSLGGGPAIGPELLIIGLFAILPLYGLYLLIKAFQPS